jgi:ribose transport system substrate-binding protein
MRAFRALCIVMGALAVAAPAHAAADGTDLRLKAAERATERAYEGTYRPIDTTPRAAAPGKHLVVISAGQASPSAKVPADGAMEAAKAIGWKAELYDGKLVPADYPNLLRQAVTAGADAILLVGIDCQAVKQPLREARAKGIEVTGLSSLDCDDPLAGNDRRGLFTTRLNYGPRGEDLGALIASFGADQARYIVAASHNKAKVILVTDPEFSTLQHIDRGFRRAIRNSGGSEIVSTLEITTSNFVDGSLVTRIQSELARHPEANWIKSPYTYATTLGIVPALGSKAGAIDVMGAEGSQDEIDLVRAGKVTALTIFSADWSGWAAVDTFNSVFRKEDPVDSGVGWIMADHNHNIPSSGTFEPPVDYRAAFRKAWAVH